MRSFERFAVKGCHLYVREVEVGVLLAAIGAVPQGAWRRAIDSEGEARYSGEVTELDVAIPGWPPGTRAICRREQPHPGAQPRP